MRDKDLPVLIARGLRAGGCTMCDKTVANAQVRSRLCCGMLVVSVDLSC